MIEVLAKELQMDEPAVRQKVEKVSSREKIKSNVDIEIGDKWEIVHCTSQKIIFKKVKPQKEKE